MSYIKLTKIIFIYNNKVYNSCLKNKEIQIHGFTICERAKGRKVKILLYGFSLIKHMNSEELNNILLEIKGHVSEIDPDIRIYYLKSSKNTLVNYKN